MARSALRAAGLAKAVLNAADRLELRQRDVAAILGASEASVSRLTRGRASNHRARKVSSRCSSFSLWYGSEEQRTAFAELAYCRLVFLEGTRADLDCVATWHTAFTVRVRTERGIDLTAAPFRAHRSTIASPTSYAETQALGQAMRDAAVEAFRYPSARDRRGGVNIGIFAPTAFGAARPRELEAWHCTATKWRVECVLRNFFDATAFTFPREDFLVDGRLPAPAI